jgi:hypothetical protein
MDLARKNSRILRKKSQMYLWNLLTVAVFYSLPVVQLVLTYQVVSDLYDTSLFPQRCLGIYLFIL